MLQGAIFDMDGILFDSERVYKELWTELAAEYGRELPENFTEIICGTGGENQMRILEKYYGVPDGTVVAKECTKRMIARMNIEVPVKPGVPEILEYMHANGVRIAVASGSAEETIRNNLEKTGLLKYFRAVVSGQAFEHGKPAPDIFLYSAEVLGLSPGNCYVFEDSFNGIRAGHAAGCRTIMVPDLIEPNEEIRGLCDVVYANMNEVLAALKNGEE